MPPFDLLDPGLPLTLDERIARLGAISDFVVIGRGKKLFRLRLGAPRTYSAASLKVHGRKRGQAKWKTFRPWRDTFCRRYTTPKEVAENVAFYVLANAPELVDMHVVRGGKVLGVPGRFGKVCGVSGMYGKNNNTRHEFVAALTALLSS